LNGVTVIKRIKADKSQGIVVFKMGHGSKRERDVFTISLYLL